MTRDDAEAVRARQWERLPHELKVALAPDDLPRLLVAAQLSPDDAKQRTVWLFDTPARALAGAGVTLRLRQKKKSADFTVKVRPVAAEAIADRWLASPNLELEADIVGGQRLWSASIERDVALAPETFDPALLSPLQRDFLGDLAQLALPAGLRRSGAAVARVWRGQEVVIEHWALPQGPSVLEASLTVAGTQLAEAQARLEELLQRAQVRRATTQATKTERLLETL